MNDHTGVGTVYADACDDGEQESFYFRLGELISICCLCGKTFTSQSLLHKHFELMHEGTEIDTDQYDLSGFTALANEEACKSNGEEDASNGLFFVLLKILIIYKQCLVNYLFVI